MATAPISAAGQVSEIGKVWFWKTVRWFFSCLLISPMAVLSLGIGVKEEMIGVSTNDQRVLIAGIIAG